MSRRSSVGPLEGIHILDFSENMAGPFGTMILGDQGADVIKVEPPRGDLIRHRGTGNKTMAGYFANLNRSKRSVAIDLQRPEAADVRERLFDWADVVVTSARPDAARRLGIDAQDVTRTRPMIVHAAIVGFGTSGPMADWPVYDHVIQALSGIAARQADPSSGQPDLVRHGIVDKATGHVLAQSICAALLHRCSTGAGVCLTINMLDVAVALLWPDGMMDHTVLEPDVREPPVAASFRLTPTKDGHVALVVMTEAQWDGLIRALGLEPDRSNPAGLLQQARRLLRQMNTEEAVALLGDHDVPCAPVVPLPDVHRHPQVVANKIVTEDMHPVLGFIRQPAPVPGFPRTGRETLRPAPLLGEHSAEVLSELGFGRETVDMLLATGTVVTPDKAPS